MAIIFPQDGQLVQLHEDPLRVDYDLQESRDVLSTTSSKKDADTPWQDRYTILVQSWSTSTKRVFSKKSSTITGFKNVIICRITMEKARPEPGIQTNKRESKLSCVLRMPELDWGTIPIKLQYPTLLPLNVWPGEMFIFGFITTDHPIASNVKLTGKVGSENVCIVQPVEHNPSFSTERWKQIGSRLESEMKKHQKHKTILSKGANKDEKQKRDSRDTGYTSTSYKYSSDASPIVKRHQGEHNIDTAHSAYKKKIEDSKLVEERESILKGNGDSKSESSAEKASTMRKQYRNDKHETSLQKLPDPKGHTLYSPDIKGPLTDTTVFTQQNISLKYPDTLEYDNETSPLVGKINTPDSHGRSSDERSESDESEIEISSVPEELSQSGNDDMLLTDDAAADSVVDDLESSAQSFNRMGRERRTDVSPCEPYERPMSLNPYLKERDNTKRHSFSELMEKQNILLASPKGHQARKEIDSEHNYKKLSPMEEYFALHCYGFEEDKRFSSGHLDPEANDNQAHDKFSAGTNTLYKESRRTGKDGSEDNANSPKRLEELTITDGSKDSDHAKGSPVLQRKRKLTPANHSIPIFRAGELWKLDSKIFEEDANCLGEMLRTSLKSLDSTSYNPGKKSDSFTCDKSDESNCSDDVLETDKSTMDISGLDKDFREADEAGSEGKILTKVVSDDESNKDTILKDTNDDPDNRELNDASSNMNDKCTNVCKIENDYGSLKDCNIDANNRDMKNAQLDTNNIIEKDAGSDANSSGKEEHNSGNLNTTTGDTQDTGSDTCVSQIVTDEVICEDAEERIRSQSFGGSKVKSASAKYHFRHSVEGNDPQQFAHVSSKKVASSPVLEDEYVPSIKVAFARKGGEDEEETQNIVKLAKSKLLQTKRSTVKTSESQTKRKLNKFYKQPSKGNGK